MPKRQTHRNPPSSCPCTQSWVGGQNCTLADPTEEMAGHLGEGRVGGWASLPHPTTLPSLFLLWIQQGFLSCSPLSLTSTTPPHFVTSSQTRLLRTLCIFSPSQPLVSLKIISPNPCCVAYLCQGCLERSGCRQTCIAARGSCDSAAWAAYLSSFSSWERN